MKQVLLSNNYTEEFRRFRESLAYIEKVSDENLYQKTLKVVFREGKKYLEKCHDGLEIVYLRIRYDAKFYEKEWIDKMKKVNDNINPRENIDLFHLIGKRFQPKPYSASEINHEYLMSIWRAFEGPKFRITAHLLTVDMHLLQIAIDNKIIVP